jgi:hypothetical protein
MCLNFVHHTKKPVNYGGFHRWEYQVLSKYFLLVVCFGNNVRLSQLMEAIINTTKPDLASYSNPLPWALLAGIPRPGPLRTLPAVCTASLRILTSSTFPFASVIAGTTQAPQLHRIPCHAYLPTLVLHFGHSRRPSTLPCSSSERIQDSGSRKWWAHVNEIGKGLLCGGC